MEAPVKKWDFAWEPFTPAGIGRFAKTSLTRLFIVQMTFALLIAASVVWFVRAHWFPVAAQAIKQLPERAEISRAQLRWTGASPVVLAENRFLALSVDLEHEGNARSPAHFSIELGRKDFKIFSLFGYAKWKYPSGWVISLSRSDALPWWGAWSIPVLAMAAAVVVAWLMVLWAVLASLRCWVVWVSAVFTDRVLNLSGAWKVAAAGLMPGAVLLTATIAGYGFVAYGLIGLIVLFALHLLVGWIFSLWALTKIPIETAPAIPKQNPFAPTNLPPPPAAPPL
jgi:hypothetical protein